jgi:prevent-host-death family protein
MEEMAISKFKATCLSVMERVRKTRKPILVTRFGKPVAQISPPPEANPNAWIGSLKGKLHIHGDIVGPVYDREEWEAFRD